MAKIAQRLKSKRSGIRHQAKRELAMLDRLRAELKLKDPPRWWVEPGRKRVA